MKSWTSPRGYRVACRDADAQSNLGYMYVTGSGVLTDYRRAYVWYSLADYNGGSTGNGKKELIAKRMRSTDISKAQEMSSVCFESGYTD